MSRKLRFCSQPQCTVRVERGRCQAHQTARRRVEQRFYRGRALAAPQDPDRYLPPAGYGRRWAREARRHLAAHPFCVDCVAKGNTVGLATEVDHEVPHRGDPVLFWDAANWRSRCKPHHSRKTALEVGLGRT